jgi:predicted MFS family arabinose efflux permease
VLVVITVAVILLILSQGLVTYFLAGVAIGIGFGFTGSSLQSLALRRAPFERRGAASSTYLLAFDIGIGSGGLLAGWVATRFGYDWMFVFMLVPMLLAFLFYFVVIRRMIKKKPLDT